VNESNKGRKLATKLLLLAAEINQDKKLKKTKPFDSNNWFYFEVTHQIFLS